MRGWWPKFRNAGFIFGLVYLNPQRPTYLEVFPAGQVSWDRTILDARLVDETAPVFNEIMLMQALDLSVPVHVVLYKLVAIDRSHTPFILGRGLLASPLHQHNRMINNDFQWWSGEDAELREAAEKARATAARAAKKAAERLARGEPTRQRDLCTVTFGSDEAPTLHCPHGSGMQSGHYDVRVFRSCGRT